MKKRTPHNRLKGLRKIIGLTQLQFAERVGVSYQTILAVETGQRPMTQRLGMLVACATGVCPFWIMDDGASATKPLNGQQEPYTRDYFEKRFGLRRAMRDERHIKDDLNHGDVGSLIEDCCERLASILRTAHKCERFWAFNYLAQEMMGEMVETLGGSKNKDAKRAASVFQRAQKAETPSGVPNAFFYKEGAIGGDSELGPSEASTAWKLMSPMAKFRWSDAMDGDERERRFLLEDLATASKVVAASFAVGVSANRKGSATVGRGDELPPKRQPKLK